MKLLTAEQMRTLDKRTIDDLGLAGAILMETAGRGVVRAIAARLGEAGENRLATVLAGPGNNGGDGFVIARELAYRGFRVHVWVAGTAEQMSPETRLHYEAMRGVGVSPRHYAEGGGQRDLKQLHRSLLRSAVIVDALLGIGPEADLREPMATLVRQLDGRHDALTVAVDLPSGLHADSGRILGAAARVDLVVTMAAAKPGLFLGDGPSCWRELEVVEIGIPPAWIAAATPACERIDSASVGGLLAERSDLQHKTQLGHLFVVAGSAGKAGAALLASHAAMRSGVGLTTLGTSGEIRSRLEARFADLMVEAVRGGPGEARRVEKLLSDKTAVAVGPGLGTTANDLDLIARLLSLSEVPVVLDADGLSALAAKPDIAAPAAGRLVLTPHPGEMARLLGTEIASVQADRLGHARQAAERWQAVVVLKGPRTLVVDHGGDWAICDQPNVALAKAGSGDVLCGILGSLLAQGLAPYAAARVAVAAHAAAGHEVRARVGSVASMASDLVDALPAVWSKMAAGAAPAARGPR